MASVKRTFPIFKKTVAPVSSSTNKRSLEDMSKPELIEEIQRRDQIISELKKKARKTSANSSPSPAVADNPEKVAAQVQKLKKLAAQQIKKQMKWKPSCKHGTARWSYSALVDENVFREFRGGLKAGEKTKGTKMSTDAFEDLLGTELCTSIRYGYLNLKGENVNITYKKNDGEMKITGGYGMV